MSKEELERNEAAVFADWLRGIETTYAQERLSYFEKNLEVCINVVVIVCDISERFD